MPTSAPVTIGRRTLLRGVASVGIVAAVTGVTACAGSDPGPSAGGVGDDASSPLVRLGQELATGPSGAALAATRPPSLTTVTSDAEARAAVDRLGPDVLADFASGRTALGDGWQLSTTEAAVLVAYAGDCPNPTC